MNRPNVEDILVPLKPFQRRTVDHAFHRLFTAPDSTGRFLVADEVGLGKTLVARGIIARAIDHLWDQTDRIDIVYICSSGSIARANLPKLQVSGAGQRSFALATRLTLLATQLSAGDSSEGLAGSKLNFVSFTPATSFDLGHATGRSDEREVLFHLLVPLIDRRTALMNLLQANVTLTTHWRWRLENEPVRLDPSIQKRFHEAFSKRADLRGELDTLLDTWFFRHQAWPDEAKWRRNQVIGNLRQLLAEVCVHSLEPDLVILDEFQRFKNLLETREEHLEPAAELAQALFQAKTPEGVPVRTLLLSATPYKLFTADAEIDHEDHYEDFLATTRFLLDNDEGRVQGLKGALSQFGGELKRAAAGQPSDVLAAKTRVEATLRRVMSRTERVAASDDRDAMVEEPKVAVDLQVSDVRQYLATDALFRAVGDHDPMVFWKSSPYLAHFMRNYRVNSRLDEALERSPEKVAQVLQDHAPAFLDAEELRNWKQLDPANAKLRDLVGDLLDGGLWRLLWLPPTVPYWPLEGPFAGQEGRTKSLLFSAWNVVPDVVSAVLSFEAERRMMGDQLGSYVDPSKQQVPLLRLTQTAAGARSRHRLFLLLIPCLTLADNAHPLTAPAGHDRRAWVRTQVDALLSDPRLPNPQEGQIDDRWEWAAPLLLDEELSQFLKEWRSDNELPRPTPEVFGAYLDDLLDLRPEHLGRRPEGLAELLTEIALGSPAILGARTMSMAGIDDKTRRRLAVTLADAFWRMFNRPAVIKLLGQLGAETPEATREEGYYWRLVLRYCCAGNLQAVLDEAWHLTWEQHAWSQQAPPSSVAMTCVRQLVEVVEPSPSRVHAQFFHVGPNGKIGRDEVRVRTDFALRFGDIRTEEGQIGQDSVRSMFNSPFRPFVLASTSVGQEGLDFHPWCHRIVHWNLPGNPVDLEQREGRVHRYKGHAVRKNISAAHQTAALMRWQAGDDVWAHLFELAHTEARSHGESDLVPYWMAPGPCRVQRHVPMLPYTKEVEAFRRLKRQLAAYRVVFGQPRQEELVTLLDQANLETEQLLKWAVDLSPSAPAQEPEGVLRVG